MVAWPAQLPAPAINTLTEAPADNLLRSGMDKGPAKIRRRSTSNVEPHSFGMKLDDAQLAIFKDFYKNVTYGGAIEFDYTHPKTNEALTVRFAERPSWTDIEGKYWACSVSLEILP